MTIFRYRLMNGTKPTYIAVAPSEGAKAPDLKREAPDAGFLNRRSSFLLAILVGLILGSIGTLWFLTPSGAARGVGPVTATEEELEEVLLNHDKEASQRAHVEHGDELPEEERPAEKPRTGDAPREGEKPPGDRAPNGGTPKGRPPHPKGVQLPQPKGGGPPKGGPKMSMDGAIINPDRSRSSSKSKSGVRGSKSKERPPPQQPKGHPPKQGPPQPKQGPPPQPKQGHPQKPKQPKQGPPK